jgi:hypothetical protein
MHSVPPEGTKHILTMGKALTALEVAPGDVLVVLATDSAFSDLIRFGARLEDKPDDIDHVIVVTHQDETGRWLGIQGHPGGVNVADVTPHLRVPSTRSNHAQPRDPAQLPRFLALCAKAFGIPYDWAAVTSDGLDALGLEVVADVVDHWIWRWPLATDELPGHVVCSNLAAVLYAHVGWPRPCAGNERECAPCDWAEWIDRQSWSG